MRASRRFWGSCAIGLTLIALALALAAPVLLVGAALLGAWLLAEQYRFVRRVDTSVSDLRIEQAHEQSRVAVTTTTPVTVHVDRDVTQLAATVTSRVPTGAQGDPPVLSLTPGETSVETTYEISWPLAGRYELPEATVVFRDQYGLFETTVNLGSTPECLVETRAPRNIHVGAGGDDVATTYGSHSAERGGRALDPAELRKYMPGDPSNRIDWKATARLDETYVRESEAQTDRESVLVVDQRAQLADGESGRTKFEFLREVLLTITDVAETLDDPLGLIAIDEAGTTDRMETTLARNQYRSVQTTLQDLEPTRSDNGQGTRGNRLSSPTQTGTYLQGDATTFGATLRPYFASVKTHVDRVKDEPLFHAVNDVTDPETYRLIVIGTDDSHPKELKEAVKLAVKRGNEVALFITPSALFDEYVLADLEGTYDQYVQFESLRRTLDRLPRTRAFEVGPGDRIDAVLTAGRSRLDRRVGNES